jgi:predicted metal-dependent RNase
VVIEAKKPGLVIGKQGSILEEIKKQTFWVPQVQRSPAIKSKIVENIREVLFANNTYRRRFLNSIGKKNLY